jgi:hypothetical protein
MAEEARERDELDPGVTDGGPWRGPTLEAWLKRFEEPEITESELRLLDGNR